MIMNKNIIEFGTAKPSTRYCLNIGRIDLLELIPKTKIIHKGVILISVHDLKLMMVTNKQHNY